MTFVSQLVLPGRRRLLGCMRLCQCLIELLPHFMQFGPQLRTHIALATQSIDRFVLCQLGMTYLRLQIMCERLHFPQRPFGLFPRRCLRRQRSLGALQPAAGGQCRTRGAAMRRHLVALVPPQYRNRNIAVLNETAAVKPAVEPVNHSMRRFRPFRLRPMTLPLA